MNESRKENINNWSLPYKVEVHSSLDTITGKRKISKNLWTCGTLTNMQSPESIWASQHVYIQTKTCSYQKQRIHQHLCSRKETDEFYRSYKFVESGNKYQYLFNSDNLQVH